MADAGVDSSDASEEISYNTTIVADVSSSLDISSATILDLETSAIGRPDPSETDYAIITKPTGVYEDDMKGEDVSNTTVLSEDTNSSSTTKTTDLSLLLALVTSSSSEIADFPDVLAAAGTEGSTIDTLEPIFTEEVAPFQQMRSAASTTIPPESPPNLITSLPTPNGGQTRSSHASAQQATSTDDFSADSVSTPGPVLFSTSRTFTLGDATYAVVPFISTFETILPNGSRTTTSVTYETTISATDTEPNTEGGNIRGVNRPGVSTGPPEPVQNTPTSFFKRPAAAAGVFIVIFLVIGCIIWVVFILRRHRRQAATGKRPKFAYGATGYSQRKRSSYMSYDARNWPERFEEDIITAPSTPPPLPAAEPPEEPRWRPGYVRASLGEEEPQVAAIIPSQRLQMSSYSHHGRTPSIQALIPSTSISPPIPPKSPYRACLPPVQQNLSSMDNSLWQEPSRGAASTTDIASNLLPPLLPICRSTSMGRRPRMRASSSASSLPHPYPSISPTKTAFDPVLQSRSPNPIVLFRRTSDRSRGSPDEDPFHSLAYVVSPAPYPNIHGSRERLSNPFADADSPPHSPVDMQHVPERIGASRHIPLEDGVSLRRNNTLRDKPERRFSTVTPEPGLMECGSSCGIGSGSEAASSSHATHPASRLGSRSKLAYFGTLQRSGSQSTAETSVVGTNDEITSPVESELFYNPDVASPVHTIDNPVLPEIAR